MVGLPDADLISPLSLLYQFKGLSYTIAIFIKIQGRTLETLEKKGYSISCNPMISLVVGAGFEPTTFGLLLALIQ